MTYKKFIQNAQQQLDVFVSQDVYTVRKLSEAEAYVWGMVEGYRLMSLSSVPPTTYVKMINDILSYVVIHRLSDDDDADVYPHGTELRKVQ